MVADEGPHDVTAEVAVGARGQPVLDAALQRALAGLAARYQALGNVRHGTGLGGGGLGPHTKTWAELEWERRCQEWARWADRLAGGG